MAKTITKCTKAKIFAGILAAITVGLCIWSFFIPPEGQVDDSVLQFGALCFAFATLFMVWEAVDRGIDAKMTHGSTSIELNNPDGE